MPRRNQFVYRIVSVYLSFLIIRKKKNVAPLFLRRKATAVCHVLQWSAASLMQAYNFGMLPPFGGVQFFG